MQQTVRRIQEITQDLPIHKVRQRRGLFTNILSCVTGLASQEQLQSVCDVLQRIETGVSRRRGTAVETGFGTTTQGDIPANLQSGRRCILVRIW